jgi:hypothetical protein
MGEGARPPVVGEVAEIDRIRRRMDDDLTEVEARISALTPNAKVAGAAAAGLLVVAWVMGGRKSHPFLAAVAGAGAGVALGIKPAHARPADV